MNLSRKLKVYPSYSLNMQHEQSVQVVIASLDSRPCSMTSAGNPGSSREWVGHSPSAMALDRRLPSERLPTKLRPLQLSPLKRCPGQSSNQPTLALRDPGHVALKRER